MLADLRAEVLHRLPSTPALPQRDIDRRRQPRRELDRPVLLRVGPLRIEGRILDIGPGGAFLACSILVESGERARLELPSGESANVRVVWIRGSAHPSGPGMGLGFDVRDPKDEQNSLELVLNVLDGAEEPLPRPATED